jgi:hypothetical protein
MTHFYELYKRVSRARRKELAKFIHKLKCICGRNYHCYVGEMLEDCDEDYVYVDRGSLTQDDYSKLVDDVTELCDTFGITRCNICDMDYQLEISLYTDF